MNIRKRAAATLICAILTLSSCSENTPLTVTQTQKTVSNGNFNGIVFDTTARTFAPAESFTTTSITYTSLSGDDSGTETSEPSEESSSAAETTTTAEVTTTTTSAATTAETTAATTTAAATTSAATTTTTTAAVTTTTSLTTTTTPITTTTAAPTTTATAAPPETTTAPTTTAASAAVITTTTAASAATAPPAAPSGTYAKNSYKATNYSEMKGVWISYIEISAYLKNKSEQDFRAAAGEMFDNCSSMGFNTVFFHTRAFGDAFYYSELYPFTKHLSGAVGKRTDYDPLKILVEEAHRKKLSFHAWINPLRLATTPDMEAIPDDMTIGKWYRNSSTNGRYVVKVGDYWYLNPAYPEVVKLIGDGVREIISGYNVDAAHIDDYFYPTTDASFDSAAFGASGVSSLSSYRLDRCAKMVREMYDAVHECSGSAMFGASTQGNMSNNINQLYADPATWCRGGYVDYLAPQIYYGFENMTQPFEKCTEEWNKLVDGTKTQLCVGLAVYKAGQEDKWAGTGKSEWQKTETMLKRQIEFARSCKNYGGVAMYSYNYLFTDGYLTPAIKKEIDNFSETLKK